MPSTVYRIKYYDPRTWIVPQWYLKGNFDEKVAKNGTIKIFDEQSGFSEKSAWNEDGKNTKPQAANAHTPQRKMSLKESICQTIVSSFHTTFNIYF